MSPNPAYRFDASISSVVSSTEPVGPSGVNSAGSPYSRPPKGGSGRAKTSAQGGTSAPLSPELLGRMQRYWQAANYLTVGQIYLQDNPLLREPLHTDHIKPRLLGHWGTSPGLSFIYVHLNRLIQEHDVNVMYLAGPGHGGPAILANVYLEGTYTEVYPQVSQDTKGMQHLFRQFSTTGGVPSHVSVPTPGSIHEGGELGYVLAHAFGAAFDNPDLVVVAVIGDGEAETAPLEGAWKSCKFLNPVRDGAVLPILHLNGYKISGPTVMGRDADEDVSRLLEGHGYEVHFVEGDAPLKMHQAFAETLDTCYATIRAIQEEARSHSFTRRTRRPRWPVIVLRTPKGWTGPKEVDGLPVEGTFRSHQVPVADVKANPEHLALLEDWMRSYHPEELFDESGHLLAELAALAPRDERRMGANPHANGGKLLISLDLPPFMDYAIDVQQPATERQESTRQLGKMMRDIFTRNAGQRNFRLFCPDETTSNRLGNVFEVENRCSVGNIISIDDHLSPDGRVMEVLSEHLCEGWLEGYLLTGRHGLFATYESFAMIADSMIVQHAKWLQEGIKLPWRAPVSSVNILLTSTCWRNDHNGFSHQGPGLIDTILSKKGSVARVYLPPDANCLLSVADHCFRSRNYVNLIVIDKQPQLQWLNMEDAIAHCTRGISTWHWASNDEHIEPDVILACAGDIPTQETIAAAWWLRHHMPELKVRVVNVVDLMKLYPSYLHPHGMNDVDFVEQFTEDKPVVFAFHGYPRAVHELVHGRPNASRFHVRGFIEEGTTTTPFNMVVLNKMSRYHLCIEALRRAPRVRELAPALIAECNDLLAQHASYVQAHLEDMPKVRDWAWTT
jgi:xylulose-5-phosphate/fructose-6-phosphate phosphoketolase